MLPLAEQFLAAMPDRIKFESGGAGEEEEDSASLFPDCCSSLSEDLGVESLADDHSVDFEFNFVKATMTLRSIIRNKDISNISFQNNVIP